MMRLASRGLLLVLLAGFTAGCVSVVFGGLGALSGLVGVVQRRDAREAQREQTEEIKKLREEIKQLRPAPVPEPRGEFL